MIYIPSINVETLNDNAIIRIRKAKSKGKMLMVHLLKSGKLIISWKFIRPTQNSDIVAVSDISFIKI